MSAAPTTAPAARPSRADAVGVGTTGATGCGRVGTVTTALAAGALGVLVGLVMGAFGAGGSILAVPALVHVLGEGPREATTGSLVIVGLAALLTVLGQARSRRVRWGTGLSVAAAGVVSSVAGTALNALVDPQVLLLAFAVLILAVAVLMLRSGSPPGEHEHAAGGRRPDARRVARVVAAGLAVGFLTGFFGVGGGFVLVPALTLALGMPVREATATSLLVIAVNCAVALAARTGSIELDWADVIPFTVTAVVASLVGATLTDRVSGRGFTRAFAGLLVLVALYSGISSVVRLLG